MGLTPIRTLIVDDEPIARQVLREELGSFADVEVCGEAGDGQDALVKVARLKPELMLLDLHMPGLGGFEVIQRLPNDALPMVVIVTAYDQHALRAFEAGALDYLLKPVSGERLEKAIERARAMRGRPGEIAESLVRLTEVRLPEAGVMAAGCRRIAGKSGQAYYLLNLEDILAFQAEREIVWILTGKQRYVATQNLRAIEARLEGSRFYRVHRNALVNLDHIWKLTPLSSQRWLLTLTNSQELIVSKRQAHRMRQTLRW
jgi:DNA-binding LytR/AlgR family response regulator